MLSCYATLAQIESDSKAVGKRASADAVQIGRDFALWAAGYVSERIDQLVEATFEPLLDTLYLDCSEDTIDLRTNRLLLDKPLLSASVVSVFGTALTQWDGQPSTRAAAYYALHPRGQTPAYELQGLRAGVWIQGASGDPSTDSQAIGVTGVWGYRKRYGSDAWRPSGDTLPSLLSSSATSITVSAVGGTQYDGSTPRFSPGQLLRLENEWLRVINVSAENNTLTVMRGVRGSTAAAHNSTTPIEIYYPEPEIVRACLRWVGLLYNNRAVYETFRVSGGDAGNFTVQTPQDAPEEVWRILSAYLFQREQAV